MNQTDNRSHRAILRDLARIAMTERGLLPDFSTEVMDELNRLSSGIQKNGSVRDLRQMLWSSIDNNDSRDLDQLSVAEAQPDGSVRILVAIADVDAWVRKESAIDRHARQNTTSVYTAALIFPMLPEQLSTDITSLNYHAERLGIVVDMVIAEDGSLLKSEIYRAKVYNRAKLDYYSVGAWLEGNAPIPEEIERVDGLAENLQLQDLAAIRLKEQRMDQGALDFDTKESLPVFDEDMISGLRDSERNKARDIIEELMICSNEVVAGYLSAHNFPSFRRVVKNPKRWSRIREIAAENDYSLPMEPDSKALQEFMALEKKREPDEFPDLSLSILKLLGPGEYSIGRPGESNLGHFGLAVRNYSHSTAPNRRYPDLITHRLLKAALAKEKIPYAFDELEALALHCTQRENDAKKVERQISKSATALVLQKRIGDRFDAIVTGANDKGFWVRIRNPYIEGRLVEGAKGIDVGQHIRVELVDTDVKHGFIDFVRVM